MKIDTIHIVKFRHIKSIDLKFGERLTAIAGQNGTGKSSILGLVGHIFSLREKDNSIKHVTLAGKSFETLQSEIFRFSYPEYDKAGEHVYSVSLDNGDIIKVKSSDRVEDGEGKMLRLNVGRKIKGQGKRQLPVIYLGLRRVYPLAEEEKINKDISKLTEDEVTIYKDLHNRILLLGDNLEPPEYVVGSSKKFYAAKTAFYDSYGNSAGEDNIGQIITALLSFRRLKSELGGKYTGGLLLIDELDATLFPAAQQKLVEILFKWAEELDIQVVFTTHSIEMLKMMADSKYSRKAEIIYLDRSTGNIKNEQGNGGITKMINNLTVSYKTENQMSKCFVFCEDEEARLWLRNLLDKDINKRIELIKQPIGGDHLITIANMKLPVFNNSIFVLDSDKKGNVKKNNKCPRVILLPGENNPETTFYNFLSKLPESDKFWGGFGEYTKQLCFKDLNKISSDRGKMKSWFTAQRPYVGKGYTKLFNAWKKDNLSELEDFKRQFLSILNKIEMK
jgi:hypothetical protein